MLLAGHQTAVILAYTHPILFYMTIVNGNYGIVKLQMILLPMSQDQNQVRQICMDVCIMYNVFVKDGWVITLSVFRAYCVWQ